VTGVVLRSAAYADAPEIVALWVAADAEPTLTDDVESVRALLTHAPSSIVVAVDGEGAIVGTVIAGWDGWRGNLYRLVVAPVWRRRGVALTLVDEAERRVRLRGGIRMSAIVVASHETAMSFWRAAGYQQQDDRARFVKGLSTQV